jgi:predicted nucleotidyltransferase
VLRQHLPELQRRYRVRALWLFGSHARGEPRRRSDIDVLVEFSETPSPLELARLQRELSLLLGKRVDLALKDALKPHIGKRILEEAIPVRNDKRAQSVIIWKIFSDMQRKCKTL